MAYALTFDTGATVELRPTTGKNGHEYLAARPADEEVVTRFGFNVPLSAVGGSLPKTVKLVKDGKAVANVTLEKGQTESGNPKVSGTIAGKIEHDGVTQTLSIRISQPQSASANVLIRSSRPGQGGGRQHTSL